MTDDAARLVARADRRLVERLRDLAGQRLVFFAGLPGTGKSLLVHQLAHLAASLGRHVHLLQWDVARPVFEASPSGRRYPMVDGVTHAAIRKAAGLWVRHAVAAWCARHPGPEPLLIGETPFVGGRFVELARREADETEGALASPSCRFAIAVPSARVRAYLEAERARRAARPLHPREREDAPPAVLRDLWRALVEAAHHLTIAPPTADEPAYDPVLYRRVYEAVLRHRAVDVIALDTILPTQHLSVYDFAPAPPDLVPSGQDAERSIAEVERRYPDAAVLEGETARWWEV